MSDKVTIKRKDGKYIELEDMADIKKDKQVDFNAKLYVDYKGI